MKNFIPKKSIFKTARSLSFLLLMLLFIPAVNAQTEISINPFDNTNNYNPIQRVVYLENGVTRVNQTAEAAPNVVINSNTNSMILDSVIVNTSFSDPTPLVLNFSNKSGLRIRNLNLTDATTGVGVAKSDTNVLANNNISNGVFKNAMISAFGSLNIKTQLWFDGSTNLPCQAQQPPQCNVQDFDILYTQSWVSTDFLLVSERWGNSTFKLRALDSTGAVIALANTLAFGSGGGGTHQRYDWNSGYANGIQNGSQSIAFTVISVSLFNTNGIGIYGFRIFNGQDEADINFFGLSTAPFTNNPCNPGIGSISGRCFNDIANNNSGVGINNPEGLQLYMNIISGGLVVATSTVNLNGTYNTAALENGNYTVNVSVFQGVIGHPAPPTAIPADWVNTIDYNVTVGDGSPNGNLVSVEVMNDVQTINVNYGIQKRPLAGDGNHPTPYQIDCNVPQGTYIPFPRPPFLGNDYDSGTVVGLIIKDWPTNLAALMHNDTTYYEHQGNVPLVCPTSTCLPFPVNGLLIYYNYNLDAFNCPVTMLLISGADSVTVNYGVLDNAGYESSVCVVAYLDCYNAPLAVGCVDFSGTNNMGTVALNWNTSSEKNNFGFLVERSNNGQDFEEIGFVNGSGNSTLNTEYFFEDERALAGNNYYRLKSVDQNQTERIECRVIQVKVDAKLSNVKVYPNPSRGMLQFNKGEEAISEVVLRDASGKILLQKSGNLTELNFEHLDQGIYYLSIQTENGVSTHKIVNIK